MTSKYYCLPPFPAMIDHTEGSPLCNNRIHQAFPGIGCTALCDGILYIRIYSIRCANGYIAVADTRIPQDFKESII